MPFLQIELESQPSQPEGRKALADIPLSRPLTTRQLTIQLGTATLARFFLNTARRFAYPFAPVLSRGLGVPLPAVTTLIAANQATGLLGPLFGPLGDRWGYRLMMLAGLAMLAVGMLAAGLLPFYGVVLAGLLLAGLGKSIFDPALQAYVGEHVPFRRRGMAIGLIEFAWAGSSLVGIPVAGLLIQRLGWRSPFLVLGGLGLLSFALVAILFPRQARHQFQQARPVSLWDAWARLGRERAAVGAIGFSLLVAMANDTLFVVFGAWFEVSFGLSIAALGAATTAIGLAELLGEGLTAAIADRIGLKRATIVAGGISVLGYCLLPIMGRTLPLALAGLFLIFLSVEFAIVTGFSLFTEILSGARATMMSANVAAGGAGRVLGALIGGPIWLAGGLPATGFVAAAISGLALACLIWGLRGWRR